MDKYLLSSKALYTALKNKGVDYLYHANTVRTSLTFIKNRSLLSRAYIESNGLDQTPQKSDNEDKLYDVWDHIFLDGLDLHKKYSRPNNYGPIVFVLKLELLLSPSMSGVFITRNNPWFWRLNDELDHRYYNNIEDFCNDYLIGKKLDSRIMFTFRSPDKSVKLNKFLEFIGIDKPNIIVTVQSGETKNIGDYATDHIRKSLNENGLAHIEIKIRHASSMFHLCPCNLNYTILYNTNLSEFKKRFSVLG